MQRVGERTVTVTQSKNVVQKEISLYIETKTVCITYQKKKNFVGNLGTKLRLALICTFLVALTLARFLSLNLPFKRLNRPDYRVSKEGPDHCLRFKAVVVVNGISFATDFLRSIKEAQNLAAKWAFEHFSGSSDLHLTAAHTPASDSTQVQETSSSGVIQDNNMLTDMRHMYKLQLQIYAQKRNLELPVYSVEKVGPCHARRFKSKVTLEGKSYKTKEFFHTVKEAENAAAEVALTSVIPEGSEKEDPPIYKSLLQEILQKEHACLLNYSTVQAGLAHTPTFVSTVEIQGETFRGQEGYTKKQAEHNVAKAAYNALKERRSKKDDKLRVVGTTAHVMETPICSAANIPVVGASNPSKNVGSDAQPMSDKQIKCFEDKGLEAAHNPFTRIPRAASSVREPISYPNTPPSTVTGSQLASDKKKMKRKILVLPQSSSSISEDVKPVIHNQKDLKIPQGPIMRAPTNNLWQLASPDPCECTLHSNKKWAALIPKEET